MYVYNPSRAYNISGGERTAGEQEFVVIVCMEITNNESICVCACVVDSFENYGFDNGTTTIEIHIWGEGGNQGGGGSYMLLY